MAVLVVVPTTSLVVTLVVDGEGEGEGDGGNEAMLPPPDTITPPAVAEAAAL